jgi:hypothetical protein
MEHLVGIALALGVCLLTSAAEMHRDRALYPVMGIIVASYYGLFAVLGGHPAIVPEVAGIAAFTLLAVIGFRISLWFAVIAIAGHGVFDMFHGHLVTNPGVPAWWPGFCMSFDLVAGAWLTLLLLTGRVPARPRHFAQRIRPHVEAELLLAFRAMDQQDDTEAFSRLERAHVLGQGSTREHVRVHWHMLLWALRRRLVLEALGQLQRVVGAASLTAFGLVPEGNTGGSNISAFRRLPIPAELAQVIAAARVRPLP